MTTTRMQWSNVDEVINTLSTCNSNMNTLFNQLKQGYNDMLYSSNTATNLQNIFNEDTVTKFNNCRAELQRYIEALKTANTAYETADVNSNITR